MSVRTVNLEAGMPTVEAARSRLSQALRSAKASGIQAVKLIHGYGSSGVGGRIRTEVQRELAARRRAGQIRDFVPGEEFSPFSAAARRMLDAAPELRLDSDYGRTNHGITVVLL